MRRWRLAILLTAILPLQWLVLLAVGSIACAALAFLATWKWDFGWPGTWLFSTGFWRGALSEADGVWGLVVPAAVISITQNGFLWLALTRCGPLDSEQPKRRPPVTCAAIVGGLLTLAIFFSAGELSASGEGGFGPWQVGKWLGVSGDWYEAALPWGLILVAALIWIPLLEILASSRWVGVRSGGARAAWRLWGAPDVLGWWLGVGGGDVHARLAGRLLAITTIESLIVLAIDACLRWGRDWPWETNRGTGTFLALWGLAWAWLWLAGTVPILVAANRRRRRLAEVRCSHCGYAKGPSPGDKCPECGHAWK